MSSIIYKAATHPPCEHCDDSLCEPCKELTEIEFQVQVLHSQLKHLHHLHCQTLVKRNHIHSPIIHRFPLEIVSYIFTLAIRPNESSLCCNGFLYGERPSPLILTEVCHTWRVLALSTPGLWSDITVDAGKPNFPLLNHRIMLSGNVPLFVRLFASATYPIPCLTEKAMSLVIKQLHRTSSLCLHLSDQFINILSNISETDYQKGAPLDELHIHRTDPKDRNFLLKFSIDPPRPRRMVLQSINQNQLLIDWSNISSVTLYDSDVLLPILTSSNNLKQLTLHGCPTPPAEQPLIINESIQELNLELSLSRSVSSHIMLTTTSLPSLRKFSIRVGVSEMPMLAHLCCIFLRRSLCPLEELSVDISTWTTDPITNALHALVEVLEITDKLQRLSVRLAGSSPLYGGLEPLIQRFNSSGFLPCLKSLFMMSRFLPPLGSFLDLLLVGDEIADAGVRRSLNEFAYEFWGSLTKYTIPQDDLLRISQLQMAGKTISVTSYADGTPFDVIENLKRTYVIKPDDSVEVGGVGPNDDV